MNMQAMIAWLVKCLRDNPQAVIVVLEMLVAYLKKNPNAVNELMDALEKK